MGTRIRKALGYGVIDFTPPENWNEIVDLAYNTPTTGLVSYLCKEKRQEILELTGEDIVVYDLILSTLKDIEQYREQNIGNCIIHQPETGIPGVLVLLPLGALHSQWYRRDNSIDYYEEVYIHKDYEPRIIQIESGIYPFSKGKPPPDIYALLMWLGLINLKPRLQELLYTYWA